MTVIKDQPLPDGHPLKTGLIVFRKERPPPSGSESASEDSRGVTHEPDQEELAASKRYELLVSELSKGPVTESGR